jgi:hypothetical protein
VRPRHDFREYPVANAKWSDQGSLCVGDNVSVFGPEPGVRGLFFVSINGRLWALMAESAFEALCVCDSFDKRQGTMQRTYKRFLHHPWHDIR